MDATTSRLLYRLSAAVVVLLFSVVGLVSGIAFPLGRAGRGLPVLGLLGSVVAILVVTTNLRRRRQPGRPLVSMAPYALARTAIRFTREFAEQARTRSSAARHRRLRAARVREAERAALEAAEVDGRLDPERIRTAAEALVRLVYLAWDGRDRERLATLVGPEPLLAWERALAANDAAGEHHRALILGDVTVDLVGLTDGAAKTDTAIVLVEAELGVSVEDLYGERVFAGAAAPAVRRLCQYWTLAQDDGPWIVQSVEERDQGDRHLTEPIRGLSVSR